MQPSDRPVRDWLDQHPATATYTATVVTFILIIQMCEVFGLLP